MAEKDEKIEQGDLYKSINDKMDRIKVVLRKGNKDHESKNGKKTDDYTR